MSLTTELIERLRKEADGCMGYRSKRAIRVKHLLREAADTIKVQSAKIHAYAMERSTAYYNGGWIPVSERLPEKPDVYTVTDSKGDVVRFVFNDTESSREYWLRCAKAWMFIEPYREDGDTE